MTIDISDNSSRISYTVAQNVTQQSFAIPFEFFDDSDISVYVDETLKVITTDYSISGGNGSTGTVIFNTAGEGETQQVLGAAGGSTVTIVRFTTIERTTDFTTGADINRAALNTQLDTLTAIAADNKDRTDRALHISNTEIAPSLELPSIDARKGRVLDFHETSGAVQAGPLSNDIATIANNITEILAADSEAAAAAASATAASASASTATTKASEAAASATAAETAEANAETAEANAETAQANAETAQAAAEAAQTAAEAAQTAAEAIDVITDATATATTLAAGASATVSVTATNGTGAFTFGIPTGPTGPTGPAGADAPVLTASEIKTSYESNSNTNAYTDAEKTKLTNVEALADVTDTANVVAALTAGTNVSISADGTISSTDTNTTYSVGDGGLTTNDFTDADHTKLDGIEAGATADQTAAEIKTAYESNADTNEFSDAEKTKLAGIETSATADQTASEIRALVESATDSNVFTDSNLTKLNGIETGATADQTGLQIKNRYESEPDTNAFTDAEKTKLTALDITAEENQNAYASLTILDASGSLISGTSALNKQELLILQEGPGVSIDKINTQQFQISAIPDLYSSFEVSPTAQPSATGDNAVAIGDGALGYGDDAISIGESSEATGNKSIALGKSALSSGVESVALGKSASIGVSSVSIGITGGFTYGSVGVNSIAIGQLAKATQANSIAIGDAALSATANLIALGGTTDTVKISGAYTLPTSDGTNGQVLTTDGSGAVTFANAGGGGGSPDLYAENPSSPTAPSATGTNAVAIGTSAVASGLNAMAFGEGSTASGDESLALGDSGAVASNAVSIGPIAYAAGVSSTSIGAHSDARSTGSTAIGYNSQAYTGSNATALTNSYASGADSFAAAVANNTSTYGATGANSIAMAEIAKATGADGIAIGYNTLATATRSAAFGSLAYALATRSVSLGQSRASGADSFAAGIGTNNASYGSQHAYSVALGYQAVTTADYQIALGSSTAQVKVSGAYTLPTSDGTNGQVLTTDGSGAVTFADAAGGGGADLYAANESSPTAQPSATGTNAIAIGDSAVSTGTRTTAFSKSRAGGWDSIAGAILNNTTTYGTTSEGNIAFGEKAKVTGSASQAIGKLSLSSGAQSMSLGYDASSSGLRSYAFGYGATANQTDSVAIGRSVSTTASNQVALGGSTQTVRISEAYTLPTTDGTNGQVLTTDGSGAVTFADAGGGGGGADLYAAETTGSTDPTASGTLSVAIGSSAAASGTDAVSIGTSSKAGSYSVGIGTSSGNIGPNNVIIGRNATTYTQSSVVIGHNADANDYGSSQAAIGYAAKAMGTGATALVNSYASGSYSFAAAIANNSSSYGATGANSVAIGQQAKASGANGLALGRDTQATATQSVSVGRNTVASGAFSAVFGTDSTASANYATVIGHQGVSSIAGKIAFAGGYDFSANGDVQQGLFILRSDTTDATAEALTTNNSTAGTTNQIVVPSNAAFAFHGTIVAKQSGSANAAAWKIEGLIVNNGGTTTLTNSATTVLDNTPSWGMALSADDTNDALAITVTGAASTNIRWVATIHTSEVTYA